MEVGGKHALEVVEGAPGGQQLGRLVRQPYRLARCPLQSVEERHKLILGGRYEIVALTRAHAAHAERVRPRPLHLVPLPDEVLALLAAETLQHRAGADGGGAVEHIQHLTRRRVGRPELVAGQPQRALNLVRAAPGPGDVIRRRVHEHLEQRAVGVQVHANGLERVGGVIRHVPAQPEQNVRALRRDARCLRLIGAGEQRDALNQARLGDVLRAAERLEHRVGVGGGQHHAGTGGVRPVDLAHPRAAADLADDGQLGNRHDVQHVQRVEHDAEHHVAPALRRVQVRLGFLQHRLHVIAGQHALHSRNQRFGALVGELRQLPLRAEREVTGQPQLALLGQHALTAVGLEELQDTAQLRGVLPPLLFRHDGVGHDARQKGGVAVAHLLCLLLEARRPQGVHRQPFDERADLPPAEARGVDDARCLQLGDAQPALRHVP